MRRFDGTRLNPPLTHRPISPAQWVAQRRGLVPGAWCLDNSAQLVPFESVHQLRRYLLEDWADLHESLSHRSERCFDLGLR